MYKGQNWTHQAGCLHQQMSYLDQNGPLSAILFKEVWYAGQCMCTWPVSPLALTDISCIVRALKCGSAVRYASQEVPQPELQPLSMEAKSATAVLKYLQLRAPLLSPVTRTLQEAARVDLWATRGAALAYTQVRSASLDLTRQRRYCMLGWASWLCRGACCQCY